MTPQRVKALIKGAFVVNALPLLALFVVAYTWAYLMLFLLSLLPCGIAGLVLNYMTRGQMGKVPKVYMNLSILSIWMSIALCLAGIAFLGIAYAMVYG